jgi:hypothetical protein
MGWTPPKTWVYKEPVPYTDLNIYLRDNMEFLYNGVQRTESLIVRIQGDANISMGTMNAWNMINSGGMERIDLGAILAGDQVTIMSSARGSVAWSLGVWLYEAETSIVQFTAASASAGESATIAAAWEALTNYNDLRVYLAVYPKAAAGVLPKSTIATERYTWLSVRHERPPVM